MTRHDTTVADTTALEQSSVLNQPEPSFTIDPSAENDSEDLLGGDHGYDDHRDSGRVFDPATTTPSGETAVSIEKESGDIKVYEPRRQTPSHVLFLPNMASRVSEKELAEFATQLPCKAKKTFMYMSDTAFHGFVECTSVEDATANLEFINSRNLSVRNKRVLAEYSKRKNVQDRKTYENRQHSRKDKEPAPSRRRDDSRREEPRPRRRSRSPPPRGHRRSPPREDSRYPSRDQPRYDRYRRDPPPADNRFPPRRYESEGPSYRREADERREPRRDYPEYSRPAYPRDAPAYPRDGPPYPRDVPPYSREAPAHPRDGPPYPRDELVYPRDAPPYESTRAYPPRSYPRDDYPAYDPHYPVRTAPPADHYQPSSRGESDPYTAGRGYPAPYQPPAARDYPSLYGTAPSAAQTQASVSHPLLGLRPTSVGTYQQYQYK